MYFRNYCLFSVPMKYQSNFICNLFILKEKQMQIQIQKKNILYTHTILPDKKHLIYKTNIMQHCTEILNTKDRFKLKALFTYIFFCVGNKKFMVKFSILI
jgi:hypothetical protein